MRVALVFAALLMCVLVPPIAAQSAPSPYVGAAACKSCHGEIYAAWEKTKHSTALNRLSASDRAGACIGCHVTGTPEQIAAEAASPTLPGVQCESCHGPGQSHVESANAGGPTPGLLTRTPKSSECERCHNDKGPHFKGFFYNAMAAMSHRTS
jgi:cytochrome c554/c'-like protein